MYLIRKFALPAAWLACVVFAVFAHAAEPIVVIAAFNLTGPEAALDLPCYRGAELAAAKIAYAPGKRVPNKPVAVIEIDDGVETPVWDWTP